MFPSKLPLLFVIHSLLIVGTVITTIALTANPLALMGLMLLWQPPPLVMQPGAEGDPADAVGQIGFVRDGDQDDEDEDEE